MEKVAEQRNGFESGETEVSSALEGTEAYGLNTR